jgi:hypothetical protein
MPMISPPILALALMPLLATLTMAAACAVLSLFVIARRWAFIGEGISHSGFGGAGLAWLLALAAPSLAAHAWMPYAAVIIFCLGTAIAIGLSKARRAGVKLRPPGKGRSKRTRRSAASASRAGRHGGTRRKVSRRRSRAIFKALRREPHRAASHRALARQAKSSARRRTAASRSAAARKAVRTKGPRRRSAAARKAARTRART